MFGRFWTLTTIVSLTLLAALVIAGRHALPWASAAGSSPRCAGAQDAATAGKTLKGTARHDLIKAGAGADCLRGGRGGDTVRGGGGRDRLRGGRGGDTVRGGGGRDHLKGGSGRDRLVARDHRRDLIRCGKGSDLARVDAKDQTRGCERTELPARSERPGGAGPGGAGPGGEGPGGEGPGGAGSGSAGSGGPASCDRFAALSGSDGGSGSRSHPFRTPQKLARSLGFGQTGCFRGGIYRFSETEITKPRITLRPYASERVTLRGAIKVKPSGHHSTIRGMKLNGSGEIGPRIYASGVVLRGNEITNDHTEICVQIARWYSDPPPRGVVIMRNRIHDCGELPSTNKDHGIYLAEARGTIVQDNWIYDNADRGIQLYHDADGSRISGNVIVRNGDGMVVNGSGSTVSERNVIQGNVIAGSYRGYNVYSGDSGPEGDGNFLRDNCVWAGNAESPYDEMGGVMTPARNYTASRNLVAIPLFVDAANDNYRLQGASRCLAKYTGTMSKPAGG